MRSFLSVPLSERELCNADEEEMEMLKFDRRVLKFPASRIQTRTFSAKNHFDFDSLANQDLYLGYLYPVIFYILSDILTVF